MERIFVLCLEGYSPMNRRLLLNLLTLPTIVGSAFCWLSSMPAHALETQAPIQQKVSEPDLNAAEPQFCVMSQHSRFNLVCEKVSQLKNADQTKPIDYANDPTNSPLEFKFTYEESNAAIALFGCDCPLCINSLRSLRTMSQTAS